MPLSTEGPGNVFLFMGRPRKEQIGKLRKYNLGLIFFPGFTQPFTQTPSQNFSTFRPLSNTKSRLTPSHTQTHRTLYRIQWTASFSGTLLMYSGEDRLISRPRYRLSWGDSLFSSVFQTIVRWFVVLLRLPDYREVIRCFPLSSRQVPRQYLH